ncbi:MAG: sensor histidine kinase [Candidatus Krumholzibacteria bacterium]|nr:sensor histidine kinase [Candidatus Krumholzibacteria bacterium]
MPLTFTQDQIALINLLLRMEGMAGIVSLVRGFRFSGGLLLRARPPRGARLRFLLLVAVIFPAGILIRRLSAQAAMDLSLEGALFAGLIGGAWVGAGAGSAVGLTCFLLGEKVSLPLYAAAGLSAGLLFDLLRRGGEIWNYSLNPLLIVYSFIERLAHRSLDRNFIPLALAVGFALVRYFLLERFGARGLIYGHPARDWLFIAIDLLVLVYTTGFALKLAANARAEMIHRAEERQLAHARLATLRSQINPHFLFNTLNSISALIRTDAETAREMTRRLSSIFRKSLEDSSDTHPLSSEIDFIDDYLSIERVRFGDERFRFERDLDPSTLAAPVPSLLLQPLVENAVKHGISRRTEGGTVRIVSRRAGSGVEIVIENDGPVFGPLELEALFERGVGLRNAAERLDIYTCGRGRLTIAARPGGGAVVTVLLPADAGRGDPSADTCVDSR